MMGKRLQLILILLLAVFLLSACEQIEDLNNREEISRIKNAEFYANLQETVALVRIPVIFIGLLNLLGGWKLGRFGLAINGFVIGGLMLYTYLKGTDLIEIEDETTLRALSAAGGFAIGILAFFVYNLMALIIGGVIGTTLLGGTWLQVSENVPPPVLLFITTFVSALLMFIVFRLFLVAFSALIGAALLMLAVPFESLWVIPVAGFGILIQSGIAWWISDDIFKNLHGDVRAAVGTAFGEVLGPVGILRERQREQYPVQEPRQRAPQPSQDYYAPSPQHQQYQPPSYQQPQAPYQQQYSPPPPQPRYDPPQAPYQPQQPQYKPPSQPAPTPPRYNQPQQPYSPPPQPPASQPYYSPPHDASQFQTQQSAIFKPENHMIALSDGRTFPLNSAQITVGRNPGNTIMVNDPQVSGSHMTFSIQPEGVLVWDNNSTNGTYLNGELLQGSYRLTTNDVLQLGAVTMRLVRNNDLPPARY